MPETHPDVSPPAPEGVGPMDPMVTEASRPARRILRGLFGRAAAAPNVAQAPPDTLDELDRSIPPILDDYSPTDGGRHQRPKASSATTVRQNMQTTFGSRYPEQHEELAAASQELFGGLTPARSPDTVPIARIDRLLAGYPNTIVSGLGEAATAENFLAVIRAGRTLLDMADRREVSAAAATATNNDKGAIAELLADKLPWLVATEGVAALERVQAIAAAKGILPLKHYLEFKRRYQGGLPELAMDPQAAVGEAPPASPFTREVADNAWETSSYMGIEQRPATWGDLAQMAAITDQWGREYGLSINRNPDGSTETVFIRSQDASIKNKTPLEPGKAVFFHSHPEAQTANGLLAPLVSQGDVRATNADDYAGGYYNVVCKNGITLQVGSRPSEANDSLGWTVASGELQGTTISLDGGTDGQNTLAVMQQLLDAGVPFAYSINTAGMAQANGRSRTVSFVHIPWEHLATSGATLDEVCFGNGLGSVLPPEMSGTDPNLQTAVQNAKYGS